MESNTKNKSTGKEVLLNICIILFLLIFVLAGSIASYKYINQYLTEKEYENLSNIAVSDGTSSYTEAEETEKPPLSIDFDILHEQNPDIVGWLYVPSLEISYPLMYSGDNDYYLHRDFNQQYAFAGSLFLDAYSKPDFSGGNTVVYGHNMIDGSMFGHLWWIPFKGVANDNPYFWVFTPKETYRYQIFSAFESDIYSPAFKQYKKGTQEFNEWCFEMRKNSFIDTGTWNFKYEDKVVTLSTCGANSFIRTLVLGLCINVYANEKTAAFDVSQLQPKEDVIAEIPMYKSILHDKNLYFYLLVFVVIAILLYILLSKKPRKKGNI